MQWSCNDEHSVRQGTSWNTVGILWQYSRKTANFDIKSCNSLRHARFSQQVCWDVTLCHSLLGVQLRRFDRWTAWPHSTEWPWRRRQYYRSNRRNYSHPPRDTASYCTPQKSSPSRSAGSPAPLIYPDRRRRVTNLKIQFTVCSFGTCTRVQSWSQIITRLQLVRSVNAVRNFVKAFFTFKMACGFAVRMFLFLPAHETYGLPSDDFHEKCWNVQQHYVTKNVSHIGQCESKFIYVFKYHCHMRFSRNSHCYTALHENPTKGLATW